MNIPVWQGLILGIVLGGAFAWWHLWALRRKELMEQQQQEASLSRHVPGSMTRVAVLLMALVLAQVLFPKADKIWLAVSLLVAYVIPFCWRMKVKYSQRK